MRIIKRYTPNGLEVEVSEGNVKKIMFIRNNPRLGIVARYDDGERVVLWEPQDVESHINDTEEQFVDRFKEKVS